MKALMSIMILVTALQVLAKTPANLETSSRSTNGKIVLQMKNNSDASLFCVSKIKTESEKSRGLASIKTYEFSAFETRSIILESNDGELSLRDYTIKCVKR